MDVRDNEMWQEGGSGGIARGCSVGDDDRLIQTSKFTCNSYLNLRTRFGLSWILWTVGRALNGDEAMGSHLDLHHEQCLCIDSSWT